MTAYPEHINARQNSYCGNVWRTGATPLSNECEYVRRDLYDDVLEALNTLISAVGTAKMADASDIARMTLKRHGR